MQRGCLVIAGCLSVLLGPTAYSGTMGPEVVTSPGQVYAGVFAGGAAVSSDNLSQFATAFFKEQQGGPLAVNAFGKSESSSAWLVGGHLGYEWSGRVLNNISPDLAFVPAAELEGYYLGGVTLKGDDLNNGTTRLVEHDFRVKYPMKTGVFLINAIFNINYSGFGRWHPYIGVGAGSAVVSISGAKSFQKTPAEPGINHYNSDPDDSAFVFAAQPKVGVNFDLNPGTRLFLEYRFLYLSGSDYTFGSTVYPTHATTTNWTVKMGSQFYNMGTAGIQFDL